MSSPEQTSVVKPSKRDIAVKQSHIDYGHPGSAQFCPIGRAGSDAVPESRCCYVWRTGDIDEGTLKAFIKFTFKRNIVREYELPYEVAVAMVKFDTEKKMVPFGFCIPLVIDFPVDDRKVVEYEEPPEFKGAKK